MSEKDLTTTHFSIILKEKGQAKGKAPNKESNKKIWCGQADLNNQLKETRNNGKAQIMTMVPEGNHKATLSLKRKESPKEIGCKPSTNKKKRQESRSYHREKEEQKNQNSLILVSPHKGQISIMNIY